MSAVIISIRPLARPTFNNANLGNKDIWVLDNAATLARSWKEQSAAIGMAATEHDEDFEAWLACQHDMEMSLHGPLARLPHGMSL